MGWVFNGISQYSEIWLKIYLNSQIITRKMSRIYIFLEYPTDISQISYIYFIYISYLKTSHRYIILRNILYRGTSHRYIILRDIPAKAWQKRYSRDILYQPERWLIKNSIYRSIPRIDWKVYNPYQPISFRLLIIILYLIRLKTRYYITTLYYSRTNNKIKNLNKSLDKILIRYLIKKLIRL